YLTAVSVYTGPGGATGMGNGRSETLRISGSTVEAVVISYPASGGGSTTTRLTYAANPYRTTLMLTPTGPAAAPTTAGDTAPSTMLTLFVPANGSNLAETQVFKLPNQLCAEVFPTTAPVVAQNQVAELFPTTSPLGGTITPGTYYLTGWTWYTGGGSGATGPS